MSTKWYKKYHIDGKKVSINEPKLRRKEAMIKDILDDIAEIET